MQFFKNILILKPVLFIVAFQILNTSIDTPAVQPAGDNYNYIDTYIEYFAEIILQYKNAIPESGDRNLKELQQHKQHQVKIQIIEALRSQPVLTHVVENSSGNSLNIYVFTFIKEINPPPEFA